jgi:hypothetical protein
MTGLRLTVGIPTECKRPERLHKAVGSALAQTVPVRVLVSDQGAGAASRELRDRYAGHPFVRVVHCPDPGLWRNWTFAAESCDTEVFAWLQDDDLLAPHFARRVLSCLDSCPKASAYVGRLGIAYAGDLANWWQATGPMVPMDLIHGLPGVMAGPVLAFGAYFTSHALSPAVAFRHTPEAVGCVRRVPADADLFAERSILAELARLGPAVCDPAIVGYWCQHEGNESRNQQPDADRQFRVMLAHVGPIVRSFTNWEDVMRGWAYLIGHDVCRRFLDAEKRWRGASPEMDAALDVLADVHPRLKEEKARAARPEVAVDPRARRAEKAVSRR